VGQRIPNATDLLLHHNEFAPELQETHLLSLVLTDRSRAHREDQILVIGCGVIGSALARHFALKNEILLCDHTFAKSSALAQEIGGKAFEKASDAIEKAEMVVLAFKPKDLAAFTEQNGKAFKPGVMVASVLSGTSVELLKKQFPAAVIIRLMPNLPMICGQGVIGFVETPEMTPTIKKKVEETFHGLGMLKWLSNDQLEALSAFVGSGPGFIFLLIEAMIDGGMDLGFSPEISKEFVLKTIEGSVALLRATEKSPHELKTNVASPGGTTMEGLKVLEEAGIRDILKKMYRATFNKAKLMQK
jgi:pyrroline-5-carboxylate reductase